MTYAAAGNRATASRIAQAYENFEGVVAALGDLSLAEAQRVTAYYLKHKLAKLDPVMGRIAVKHGAYLDRDVILRALGAAARD